MADLRARLVNRADEDLCPDNQKFIPVAAMLLPLDTIPISALSATSAILAASAGFRTLIYAWGFLNQGGAASFWKFQSSGTSSIDETGAAKLFLSAQFTQAVSPPAYLVPIAAGSAAVLNLSGNGIIGGFVSYWRSS